MGTHTQDVTVVGWVGSDLRTYHLDGVGGVPYAQFRLASTRRVLDRQTGAFRDGPTLWFTVKAWRTVAVNLGASLRKGDPVVVVGRLAQSEWVAQDGAPRSELVLEALALGHDLGYGTSQFRRTLSGVRRGRDEPQRAPGDAAGPGEEPAGAFTDDPWATAADEPPVTDEPEEEAGDTADADRAGAGSGGGLALAGRG
ncbi:single-stranded DNA-binding protein [Cellulomonas wangsupingiae]|uniref:Single-stranded DNA-binding protein n=1 Tax=Cellulomonas wangsupingiae TaxID=2968085 RepID=A0ABY5K9A9_9CELL|nr:single-stranded DNA-binding protein [Cellulomonas wangsupingiae]MCC2334620.1 single-stranded DNA-binding protein [Cellulomonas wangsupingiae]MCM0638660.1 single-stranded DNA-binding protein [Cellulomonas wangsupingiae]UUI66414.1 single-stranded DNA-binding protein [Cellulomonas wangsupingiae]